MCKAIANFLGVLGVLLLFALFVWALIDIAFWLDTHS